MSSKGNDFMDFLFDSKKLTIFFIDENGETQETTGTPHEIIKIYEEIKAKGLKWTEIKRIE